MGLAARATTAEIEHALAIVGRPDFTDIRKPEIGLVMLRGRMGGDGAPFNLGEATVTPRRRAARRRASRHLLRARPRPAEARGSRRCSTRSGSAASATCIETRFIEPVAPALTRERDARRRAETAATRVDFFTLVRGED